jgi:hypothetical protein
MVLPFLFSKRSIQDFKCWVGDNPSLPLESFRIQMERTAFLLTFPSGFHRVQIRAQCC